LNSIPDALSGDDIQFFLGLYQDLNIREKLETAGKFLEQAKQTE